MFISQTHASALVFNHYVSYVYFVYIIYDLVINVKENRNRTVSRMARPPLKIILLSLNKPHFGTRF